MSVLPTPAASAARVEPMTVDPRPTINDNDGPAGEVLVRVENVSKKFCRNLKKSLWYGLQDMAAELKPWGRRNSTPGGSPAGAEEACLRPGEFWANRGISFELRRGECLGLVGHNGAGKTTLLKMLNGLIKPDSGRIELKGRVGALIALGAGFNPILTGRENIYVNGAVLGLSKHEVDEKIEEIIDFSEIREFIDSPVQSYSSGMQVRLGFAIATAIKPDVLILDEVLAVGDSVFRAKCFKRIGAIINQCAVIFVSHEASQVARICSRALLLDHGRKAFEGPTDETLEMYKRLEKREFQPPTVLLHESISTFEYESTTEQPAKVCYGNSLELQFKLDSDQALPTGLCLLSFFDSTGNPAGQVDFSEYIEQIPRGTSRMSITVDRLDLSQGQYTANLAIFGKARGVTLIHCVHLFRISVTGTPHFWCAYKIPVRQVLVRRA